jgi:iron complex transport system permease protein
MRASTAAILLSAALLALSLLALVWGPAGVLGGGGLDARLILKLRFSRLLAAVSVGGLLALAGYHLQYAVSNELAAPDILGILQGANAGAMAAILAYNGAPPIFAPLLAGFAGALLAYLASVALAARMGLTKLSLVLAGIAVTGALGGLSAVLTLLAEAKAGLSAALVLLGSFSFATPVEAVAASVALAVLVGASVPLVRGLDLLSYGDEVAEAAGYNPRLVRLASTAIAAAASSVAVYVAGMVGFVSLIAPNIARLLAGGHPASSFTPSILTGALIALSADQLSRLAALTPLGEMPAGLITTGVGGVFLAYLLASRRAGQP